MDRNTLKAAIADKHVEAKIWWKLAKQNKKIWWKSAKNAKTRKDLVEIGKTR